MCHLNRIISIFARNLKKMTKIQQLIGFLFFGSLLQAQIHEAGVFLGGSNYIGDVGSTSYINPNKLAFGVLYRWNKSPRHSYRFSYTQAKLAANDAKSEEIGRKQRNLNFENSVKEVSLAIEFNFFDFNLHQLNPKITPYVATGLSYTMYNGMYLNLNNIVKDQNRATLAVPIHLGIKTNIKKRFVLSLEVGARYTFSEDLDGSYSKNKNLQQFNFGKINNKDWYVFSGALLTYTFGENPCFCAD